MILIAVAAEGYKVTIIVTPPTGPYRLFDRTIDLSCFVDPTPPDPVTYQWRVFTRSFDSWEPNGQNISYSPYRRDFHYIWFYCSVLSNAVQVTQGKKVIEVYGRLLTW